MIDKKTSVTLKGSTKNKLDVIGHKGMSYDDIINNILHQRNILMIHALCQGRIYDKNIKLEEECREVFREIDFIIAPPHHDRNGGLIEWKSFSHCLEWAMEMALDEDFIGANAAFGDRELPLGEVVTNVYCLMNEITAPTWSIGAMKNPFAP